MFRHRAFSAQEVYNRAYRDEISAAARAAMQEAEPADSMDNVNEADDEEEDLVSAPAFVGLRQRILSKMFAELPIEERERYKKIAEVWNTTRAPKDMVLR